MMMMMMMRSGSLISFVRNSEHFFLQSYFEGGGCRVIGAAVHVHHQGCVGGVGDENVGVQHYDLDAAANARNWCVLLAPAGESEVQYSRASFGKTCSKHQFLLFGS